MYCLQKTDRIKNLKILLSAGDYKGTNITNMKITMILFSFLERMAILIRKFSRIDLLESPQLLKHIKILLQL